MGVGMTEWQRINTNRGKFYTAPKSMSSKSDQLISFPLFGSDPFDTGAGSTTSAQDVAVNSAISTWDRAGGYALNGDATRAEVVKQQLVRTSSEKVINALGYQYLNHGYASIAVDIFKRNVDAHPNSWNAYDSLAEAQAKAGDTLSSLLNYNKALSFATDSTTKTAIHNRIKNIFSWKSL